MSCVNCSNAVRNAVTAIDGVIDVVIVISNGRVTIEHNSGVSAEAIKNSIIAAGYSIN
jgi:copper chaperone CopZ